MAPIIVIEDTDLNAETLNGSTAPSGFGWLRVSNGSGALEQLQRKPCSLLLTGLKPTANGSSRFLANIRQQHPRIPVVLVTGDSQSEATVREALEAGIAGCLPKQNISTDLARTLKVILDGPGSDDSTRICYTLDNGPELLPLVVQQVRQLLQDWSFADDHEPVRATVALSEALDNALYHGNLELDSALRQGDGTAWRDETHRRRLVAPYRDRRIRFGAVIGRDAATFTIADEGTGFDRTELPDCTDPQNLERCSGRGLMLMCKYMDEVTFNALGNEVTMIKRRPRAG